MMRAPQRNACAGAAVATSSRVASATRIIFDGIAGSLRKLVDQNRLPTNLPPIGSNGNCGAYNEGVTFKSSQRAELTPVIFVACPGRAVRDTHAVAARWRAREAHPPWIARRGKGEPASLSRRHVVATSASARARRDTDTSLHND